MNSDIVTGRPAWFLRLVPDIFMLGYLGSTKLGATFYNLGHSYLLPSLVGISGYYSHRELALATSLIWLVHIGMDRVAGYGLKYDDAFKHTHLGVLSSGK